MLKKTLAYDELLTLLYQVELVINNQPLCYTDDKDTPLTPNNLIYEDELVETIEKSRAIQQTLTIPLKTSTEFLISFGKCGHVII